MMRPQGDEMEDSPPAVQQFMAHTTKAQQQVQSFLDSTTPYTARRWGTTAGLLVLFMLRIVFSQGWYIVCYALFIYLLNLFLAFLQPKFDPSLDADLAEQDVEEGEPGLPTSASSFPRNGKGNGSGGLMSGVFGQNGGMSADQEDEFKPFIRRLPEFKFWLGATQAIIVSLLCTFFSVFDIPVFWPVLVIYWVMLTALTMRRQIQHMIKYRYVPWDLGKMRYGRK
ncbi:hypothetical protein CBS101457_000531 [Exobasidium rhododendri]|nr:hypothetical protein CBS101457_000531 [Exobasidium rhododendri]